MSNAKIGILHPGEMGISVAASAKTLATRFIGRGGRAQRASSAPATRLARVAAPPNFVPNARSSSRLPTTCR